MTNLQDVLEATRVVVTTPQHVLLLAFLVVAAVHDVRTFRIPNALTVGCMVAGGIASTLTAPSPLSGFGDALAGIGVALLCLLPLHILRAMGASDVKLLAAVGAFVGVPGILATLVFVVLAGGVLALGTAFFRRAFGRLVGNIGLIGRSVLLSAASQTRVAPVGMTSTGRLPYAVPILVGTAIFLVARQAVAG